jgi:hypothetical protein
MMRLLYLISIYSVFAFNNITEFNHDIKTTKKHIIFQHYE